MLGHGLELARGAGLTLEISADALPLLPAAEALARDGAVTGASHRNWSAFGEAVDLPEGFPEWRRHLLTDPQTSGGLLVSCGAEAAEAILALVREGRLRAGVDHRTHSDRPCADPDHLISLLRPVAAIGAMPKLTGFRPGIRECLRLDGLALPPCDSRQMRPLRSLFD